MARTERTPFCTYRILVLLSSSPPGATGSRFAGNVIGHATRGSEFSPTPVLSQLPQIPTRYGAAVLTRISEISNISSLAEQHNNKERTHFSSRGEYLTQGGLGNLRSHKNATRHDCCFVQRGNKSDHYRNHETG